MKKLAVVLTLVGVCASLAAVGAAVRQRLENPALGMIRHVVLFKFKDGTSEADVKKITDAFAQLPEKIAEIADFEWGTDNSPEGLAQGFTHCFLVTFKDAKARDAYLPHPAHKAFVDILKPHLDKVLVVDYVAAR